MSEPATPPPAEVEPANVVRLAGPKSTERPPRPRVLPGPQVHPWRRAIRYYLARIVAGAMARAYLRPRLVDGERLPDGPAVYCFNHLNWIDPFVLMGTLPLRPRLFFFGPREEDMAVGGRNRLMTWTGATVPYRPGKDDLLGATRRVQAVFDGGGVLAIAGEGRIHARESEIGPLEEGPGYFAIRSGVPVVPIAINGTSWLRFGRRVRVRVGESIPTGGRASREAIEELTRRTRVALQDLVADAPDLPAPGPIGRRITELFNEWPEGSRPA